MSEFEDITFREIQHFLYCPHRWGLMQFDCSFGENAFVQRGNLVHKRVDETKGSMSRSVIHRNSVKLFHDEYGIYGVADCMEFKKDPLGVTIPTLEGKFRITIVEYKVTAPKKGTQRQEDKMQLLAQKLSADRLFSCDCDSVFYYADTKKRVDVQFTPSDLSFFQDTLEKIKEFKKEDRIPPKKEGQKCSGCSMDMWCLQKKKK